MMEVSLQVLILRNVYLLHEAYCTTAVQQSCLFVITKA